MARVITTVEQMREASARARSEGASVVLVPTMGALHEGHRALLRKGRALGGLLVLSVFVNPAQFGQGEDIASYPRDLEKDLDAAAQEGVDIAFAPTVEQIYPAGFSTFVEVEGLSSVLCGASRPGHFRGVATVVLKLFNAVMPHKAIFGLKDFQQLRVIERMTRDLGLGVQVVGIETVREADGLAMSSRNAYLTAHERAAAARIPEALGAARGAFEGGERLCGALIEKAKKIMEKEPLAVIDYIKVCHGQSLEELQRAGQDSVIFIAVRIGKARLIDNLRLA